MYTKFKSNRKKYQNREYLLLIAIASKSFYKRNHSIRSQKLNIKMVNEILGFYKKN